jgi:glycosyltransferase involved in cell wall biosynthesis
MTQNKVAVITPYYKESVDILRKCHESVMQQTVPCDHIMVSDGFPCEAVHDWSVKHIVLPSAHGDFGNIARGLGGVFAAQGGYQFIAYLDADNWYEKNHIESLMNVYVKERPNICSSLRQFYTNERVKINQLSEQLENSHQHIDTNCMMIHQSAFKHLDAWLKIPKELSIVGDRVFYQLLLKVGCRFAFTDMRTVCYTTLYKNHYLAVGLPVPAEAKEISNDFKKFLGTIEGINLCAEQLHFLPRL